nr:FtsK/SpoIIIE domain-containing protein [Angustibacter aerolatus]
MVASLAIANRPDEPTFVLVDYKGGSAFKDCNHLPHTVGMVTDLDEHLVGRALTSLGAEPAPARAAAAVPGAKDLEDYWAMQARDATLPAMPRLLLVIDEFASMVRDVPDFVEGLVSIAQRGRSLGIHLILATQRPSGVVSADIRANTNLRISLRVTDEGESRDVIDAPDAGHISQSTPGRGYVRTGHASLMPFQAGRVGGARPGSTDVQVSDAPLAWPLPWSVVGQPAPGRPRPQGTQTDDGDTDLSVLVEAITEANAKAGVPRQHSPWLPALAESVVAADLPEAVVAEALVGDGRPPAVRWAVEDHPDRQAQPVVDVPGSGATATSTSWAAPGSDARRCCAPS